MNIFGVVPLEIFVTRVTTFFEKRTQEERSRPFYAKDRYL
jgi:hypothetical protein